MFVLFESFFVLFLSEDLVFPFSVMITWRAVSVKPAYFVLWRFTAQLARRLYYHIWPSCLEQRFEFILVHLYHLNGSRWNVKLSRAWDKVKIWVIDRTRNHNPPKFWNRDHGLEFCWGFRCFLCGKWAFLPYSVFTGLKICHLSLFYGYL